MAFDPADTKVLHTYDAGGIRKAKILDDETVTESFYSGLPTLNEVETPAVGSPVEFRFLMGHQLMGFESGGDFLYLLTDGLTSVRIVVDGTGDEVAAYEYLEFGEQTKTGSGSSPKTFVGGLGVHDDSALTNLLYMRRRHYDASLGRFISRDPIGFRGGLNLYNYCINKPVNCVDPLGLMPDFPPGLGPVSREILRKWAEYIVAEGPATAEIIGVEATTFLDTILPGVAAPGGSVYIPSPAATGPLPAGSFQLARGPVANPAAIPTVLVAGSTFILFYAGIRNGQCAKAIDAFLEKQKQLSEQPCLEKLRRNDPGRYRSLLEATEEFQAMVFYCRGASILPGLKTL